MPAEKNTDLVAKLTDGTLVNGKTNLRSRNRLSDVLNLEEDPFLVLYDAAFAGKARTTIFINKQHIVWVKPADEPSL